MGKKLQSEISLRKSPGVIILMSSPAANTSGVIKCRLSRVMRSILDNYSKVQPSGGLRSPLIDDPFFYQALKFFIS